MSSLVILLSALKKGMTADDFFNVAESTLDHLRGHLHSDTIEKIMNDTASADEVDQFIASLGKKIARLARQFILCQTSSFFFP